MALDEGDDRPGVTSAPGLDAPVVTVTNVAMSYDFEPVLHDVSFVVPAGETTVIMGPSGVGKTTLIRAVLGLREPDHGDVTIGGRSVTDADPAQLAEIRRGIGVMLGGNSVHDGSIFASLSAWENVRYPLLQNRGYDDDEVEDRAWRRMIEFDLTDYTHQMPHELSGGTRRRLALARAFVDDPRLLILDDPGTALDLANRDQVTSSIRAARERTSATVLITCHDIDMAKALGDHLVVILGGRVAASGPAGELLDGIYETDDFDARFKFRAAFDADVGNSLSYAQADREFRSLFERLTFAAVIALALVSLAGAIFFVVLTAQTVY